LGVNCKMYKIKLGINNRTILKPKANKIYKGVEDKYRNKGSWNGSVRLDNNLRKSLNRRSLPPIRKSSHHGSRLPRKSQIYELTMNNFDSLSGFESFFGLLQNQKELIDLEVKITRKKRNLRTTKS
jgi:hypothetical protein